MANERNLIKKMLEAYRAHGMTAALAVARPIIEAQQRKKDAEEMLAEVGTIEGEYHRSCSRCGKDATNNLLRSRRFRFLPKSAEERIKIPMKYLFNLKETEAQWNGPDSDKITGAEVRTNLCPDQASYSIFLEHQGNTPDQLVQDGDIFKLADKPLLRFYSVPPCHGA